MREIREMIREMSTMEKIGSIIFILTILAVQVVTKASPFALATAVLGICYGLSVKYGIRAGLFIGIMQTVFASYTALINGIYGDFALNGVSCIILIIGFIRFNKIGTKDNLKGIRYQNVKQQTITFIGFLVLYGVMFIFLTKLGSYKPYVDAFNSTCSILAVILLNMKFADTWKFWTLCNISSLGLYLMAFVDGKPVLPIVVLFMAFLLNSVHAQIMNKRLYGGNK